MSTPILTPLENATDGVNKMLQSKDVNAIHVLRAQGWGSKSIAKELGLSRRTVKKYIQFGIPQTQAKARAKVLDGLESWLAEQYEKHQGNADVIRQELLAVHQLEVSLRTVERAVSQLRQETMAKAKATIRFETAPGKQLQIDFGSTHVKIGGQRTKIFIFAATLGFSRRFYIKAFLHERQSSWFEGIEGAFMHFEGITEEVLLDNARALVSLHNKETKEIVYNDRFKAFAKYWDFKPKACQPYRARTKGKDERMVGYVKHNAIAGHEFSSWEALESHLHTWNANVADNRIHKTTERRPIDLFNEQEREVLRPHSFKPPFIRVKEMQRIVQVDACVEVDTNYYTVPHNLIGQRVMIQIVDNKVSIYHNHVEIATHSVAEGRRQRSVNAEHLKGIVGASQMMKEGSIVQAPLQERVSELQRPLSEYELVVGGGW